MRLHSYVKDDNWGGGDNDPDRFTRHSFWWLLGFGLLFYGLCASFVIHDLLAYRAFLIGEPAVFWISERFGRVGAACLFFGLVLFLPAAAVWVLARFFDIRDDGAI